MRIGELVQDSESNVGHAIQYDDVKIVNDSVEIRMKHSKTDQTGEKRVWVVGSSIVKHAFVKARTSYDGVNMGLQRCNTTVWWQGQGGMRWNQLERKLTYLQTFEDFPRLFSVALWRK
ncbi:hypothetical protein FSP39_007913 [Pinctada imbricata]|uniref:Uncharacterized protein n=1 Tax=Pinctada imbricata TaxID=66713 RepID=A0AA88YJA0_PINIB|nr:hypothetical protein FSP39_007913 [Pinctada imbricata]